MYDGTRLAFMIERQGMDDDTVLSPYLPEGATNVSGETQKKVPVEQQKKRVPVHAGGDNPREIGIFRFLHGRGRQNRRRQIHPQYGHV
ncbi:hypothetical protein VQ056_02945 [Paenibacillus sp. JTLBN-2024]